VDDLDFTDAQVKRRLLERSLVRCPGYERRSGSSFALVIDTGGPVCRMALGA